MNGAATDGLQSSPVDAHDSAESTAARIPEIDDELGFATRERLGRNAGRLADVAGWLAGSQGRTPPSAPRRPRCVVIGDAAPALLSLADELHVGVRVLPPAGSAGEALHGGISAADDEVDAGADLVVLAADAAETDPAPAALVTVLRGVEPVALLPRGAAAADSGAWTQRAGQIRDLRRVAMRFRSRPDRLLAALGSARLAAAAGFLLQVTARRTPVVLDGSLALAAALFSTDIAPQAVDWWQAADASPDPVHARACRELGLQPLLALGIDRPSGIAGLLALPVLQAAAAGCA